MSHTSCQLNADAIQTWTNNEYKNKHQHSWSISLICFAFAGLQLTRFFCLLISEQLQISRILLPLSLPVFFFCCFLVKKSCLFSPLLSLGDLFWCLYLAQLAQWSVGGCQAYPPVLCSSHSSLLPSIISLFLLITSSIALQANICPTLPVSLLVI